MSQPGARAQVFNAPTPLRDRIGSRFAKIDPAALAKAEAALQGLSNNFGRWLEDEIGKLEASRETIRREGASVATMDALFTHAHDLKGLGSTYGFPIITRIAGSLCRLLGDGDTRVKTPLALVDAHIHTIRAAVRDDIRDADGPVGRALAEELERQTRGNLAEG